MCTEASAASKTAIGMVVKPPSPMKLRSLPEGMVTVFMIARPTGDTFSSISGALYYSYGNFKIVPRDASDVVE